MDFDFDRVIERRGTDSFKWWGCEDRNILPLPVADMDFAAPPAVLDALHRRVDHGVFGYGHATRGVAEAVVGVLDRDHGWRVDPAWIVWLPGVVPGLGVGCRMLAPTEAAVTFTPVYPPFLDDSILAGRSRRACRWRTARAGGRSISTFWLPRRRPTPGCSCSAARRTRPVR